MKTLANGSTKNNLSHHLPLLIIFKRFIYKPLNSHKSISIEEVDLRLMNKACTSSLRHLYDLNTWVLVMKKIKKVSWHPLALPIILMKNLISLKTSLRRRPSYYPMMILMSLQFSILHPYSPLAFPFTTHTSRLGLTR
jgi:hypothetical protein